jgi:hypothetical protein
MPDCSMELKEIRRDTETSQFADHLARGNFATPVSVGE